MDWNKKKIDMIKKKQVVYVITKNGSDLISYDEFVPCMMALTNLMSSDKDNKYDVQVRPKVVALPDDNCQDVDDLMPPNVSSDSSSVDDYII